MNINRIRELFDFNPDNGVFRWKKPNSAKVKPGDVAGWKMALGYRAVLVDGKQVYCHRLAWLLTHGEMPKGQIDHINGVRDDNRPRNLRDVSHKENHQNVCQPGSNKLAGSSWDRSRKLWTSHIRVDGKHIHLGRFATAQEAHETYIAAKRRFHPFASIERIANEKTRTRAATSVQHSAGPAGVE